MSNKKPYEGIVVLGMPRSGTTLLRRILNAHPEINCPPETNLLNGCSRLLYEEEFSGGLSIGIIPGLGFSGFSKTAIHERVREFAFGFFRELLEKSGKKIWAEKTAFDSFYTEKISQLCGERCRYICLFRHPLDVVVSLKEMCDKMEMQMSELHSYTSRHASPLVAFAHAWADVTQSLLSLTLARPNECISLRYEDLVQDTDLELTRLFEFLELDADVTELVGQAMQKTGDVGLGDWKTFEKSRISESSIGRGANISEFVKSSISPLLNPLLETLGYDQLEMQDQVDAEEARHRYQLALMTGRMKSTPEA